MATLMIIGMVSVGGVNVFAASGNTYYVAANGKDSNSGLDINAPISLKGINKIKLKGGDTVLFKRGDTFYGYFAAEVNTNYVNETSKVIVDAYGEGAKPVLSLAKIVSKEWEDCGNGFYKIDLSNPENYTGVGDDFTVGNGDIQCYAVVNFIEAEDGTIHGQLKENAESCTEKYQFYHDETCVYIKTDIEPSSDLGTVTMPIHPYQKPLVRARRGMEIRNLHLKYAGYGIGAGNRELTRYVVIENCIIEKLGGADIDSSIKFTRGGNGIELGDYGSDIVIRNNILRDIYDVGFSPQGRGSKNSPARWENITVTNNIFAFNTQAFETWVGYSMKPEAEWTDDNGNGKIDDAEKYYTSADVPAELDYGIRNLNFTNNLCIGQSEGWTTFRGRTHNTTDILSYGYSRPTWQMVETGNTYFHLSDNPAVYGLCLGSDAQYLAQDGNYNIVTDYNYMYLKDATSILYRTHNNKDMTDFAGWQALGQDQNSQMYTTGENPEKYADMYEVAATSLDFNDIAQSAKEAGVKFTLAFDENATSSKALESNITANGCTADVTMASADKCRVTVTLDTAKQEALKVGGLTYTYGGKTYPITSRVGAAKADGAFDFDSESQVSLYEFIIDSNATDVSVNAEFVDKGSKNLGVIGASVNKADHKLRFRSRADRTYICGGFEYKIESCGTLLFKEEQTDLEAAHLGVQVGTTEGRAVPTTQLYDRTDNYYEYVCFVDYGSADSEYLDDDYYAYTYATYKAKNGSTVTVYSDGAVVHSFNSVVAAIS